MTLVRKAQYRAQALVLQDERKVRDREVVAKTVERLTELSRVSRMTVVQRVAGEIKGRLRPAPY